MMTEQFFLFDTQYKHSLDEMIEKTEKHDHKISYYYNKEYINGKTIQYEIFDGIWLVYHDLAFDRPELYPFEADGLIQLNYCISGRCEVHVKKSKVFYIGAGDFIVALLKSRQCRHSFPLGNYKGISIMAKSEKLDNFLQTIFPNTKMAGKKLITKLEKHSEYFLLSNNTEIKNIMQELIVSDQELFKETAIVKFAELIILIMKNDIELQADKPYFDRQMVQTVKKIKQEVTVNIEQHMKIEEIAFRFHISSKAFSECFKAVYGKTYYSFIKEFRIKKAADLLLKENHSVADIAMMAGYQNASKFSKAFSDIMGVTPICYRRNHSLTSLD